MNIAAQLVFSAGFGLLYLEMGDAFQSGSPGRGIGLLAFLLYLAAFYLPQVLFRYDLSQPASTVLGQLSRRWLVAAALTLVLNVIVVMALAPALPSPVPLIMEVYGATFLGLLIFHSLLGVMAEQANYLQRTAQYHSTQLFLAVLACVVLFIVLALYFLAFDLAVPRAPRIYVRDMIFGTLALGGLAWFLYRVGHH